MGIIESNPEIKGKTISLETQEEKAFFNNSHQILRNNFYKNAFSNDNLYKSFEFKSFKNGVLSNKKNAKDISWIEYLSIYTNNLKNKYHSSWANELLNILNNFKKTNIRENKFCSDFFFNEYEIKTIPKIIDTQNEKVENKNEDLYAPFFSTELTEITLSDKNYCELDVLDNLGGSYIELNYDELLPDDPALQYQKRRINVKKYIKIFKEHIYNNKDHPISQTITIFNKLFSKYIEDKLKEYKYQLENQTIDQERFDTLIKTFENEITESLQEFISRMHSALKLFYSATLDYSFFTEEKDDLINMITSYFFRTGKLYESILNLYSYSFKNEFQTLQGKLIELKSSKPNTLGVEIKFCLDEETIKLQNQLRNKGNSKNNDINNDINDKNKNKITSLFSKIPGNHIIKTNSTSNNLCSIIEEKEDIISSLKNIEGQNLNDNDQGQIILYLNDDKNSNKNNNNNINQNYFIPQRSNTKLPKLNKEDDYILEKLPFLDDGRSDYFFSPLEQIRYSVNSFNNKTLLYPKLHEQLKKNFNIYESTNYSKNKGVFDKKLPIPYSSAINLLKSIKKYKTPFEKILLIASIIDHIMESVDSFWKDMEQYIEKDFLFIETEEIMSIFLYIIIQSQMPEIYLYCKIINNFTTDFTKRFNISYNYTLLEGSIDEINELDIKDFLKKENGYKELRRSILDNSNQRISRLSLGLGNQ